jgi:hypothetical protein
MTKDEKLQAITSMGVYIAGQCPDISYGINNSHSPCRANGSTTWEETLNNCQDCWIEALEGQA